MASVLYEVYDTVWLTVSLKDASDETVMDDFGVLITVEGDADELNYEFLAGGLVSQSSLETGDGIQGTLGIDGTALVGLVDWYTRLGNGDRES